MISACPGRSGPKRLDSGHCGVALSTPSRTSASAAVPHPRPGRCLSTLASDLRLGDLPERLVQAGVAPDPCRALLHLFIQLLSLVPSTENFEVSLLGGDLVLAKWGH